jgi:hypothetical protein
MNPSADARPRGVSAKPVSLPGWRGGAADARLAQCHQRIRGRYWQLRGPGLEARAVEISRRARTTGARCAREIARKRWGSRTRTSSQDPGARPPVNNHMSSLDADDVARISVRSRRRSRRLPPQGQRLSSTVLRRRSALARQTEAAEALSERARSLLSAVALTPGSVAASLPRPARRLRRPRRRLRRSPHRLRWSASRRRHAGPAWSGNAARRRPSRGPSPLQVRARVEARARVETPAPVVEHRPTPGRWPGPPAPSVRARRDHRATQVARVVRCQARGCAPVGRAPAVDPFPPRPARNSGARARVGRSSEHRGSWRTPSGCEARTQPLRALEFSPRARRAGARARAERGDSGSARCEPQPPVRDPRPAVGSVSRLSASVTSAPRRSIASAGARQPIRSRWRSASAVRRGRVPAVNTLIKLPR